MKFEQFIELYKQTSGLLDVIAWPLTVFFVIFLFRHTLIRLFDDVVNMKLRTPGGAELTLMKEQAKKGEAKVDDMKEKAVLEKKEENVLEDEETLKKQLQETREWVEFEKIYREIFGSQIALLESLVTFYIKESGVFYLFFKNHFQSTKKLNPALASWTTAQYLNYLFLKGLIIETEKEPISIYNLTERGFNFIHYLNWNGYPKDKLF